MSNIRPTCPNELGVRSCRSQLILKAVSPTLGVFFVFLPVKLCHYN